MPPVLRREAVAWQRLHVRIREGAGRALTLVAAGPGFGKPTLLAARREDALPKRAVAWLTLGGGRERSRRVAHVPLRSDSRGPVGLGH